MSVSAVVEQRSIDIVSQNINLSQLGKKNILFGPPGTGKTSTIQKLISEYYTNNNIDEQVPSCYYITYSRALAAEARKKIGRGLGKRHIGTFHSIFARLLGWNKGDFLTPKEISTFCSEYSLTKLRTALDEEIIEESTEDDWTLFSRAYDFVKNQYPSLELKLSDTIYQPYIDKDLDALANAYETYKKQLGKYDYTDILVEIAKNTEILPAIKLLFIDEAQDLTPLMWYIARQWMNKAEKTVIAGDDDQSIFSYRGADPHEFLKERETAKIFHLTQSFRLPLEVKDIATKVIENVEVREKKDFNALPKHATVEYTTNIGSFLQKPGTKWILGRTHYVISEMTKILDDYHVVYLAINSKHRTLTLWSKKLIKITNILHNWPPADPVDITILVKLLPASIMVRGVKTKILNGEYFKEKTGQQILDKDNNEFSRLFKITINPEIFLKYANIEIKRKELVREQYRSGINDNDIVYIDTFHASKGGEADQVAVILNITKKIAERLLEDQDQELRTLYVALTRTKNDLTLISLLDRRVGVDVYSI